jgi:hypothetical protein
MCTAPHASADFSRSQKPAIDAAQIRIIFISPRQRQRDVDWRCAAARQLNATRPAYHAVFAHAHAPSDLASGQAIAPKIRKLLVALFIPG